MSVNAMGEEQHWFWKPKFILAGSIFTAATTGLFTGFITEIVWRDLMIALYGSYAVASVAENKLLKPTMTVTTATKNQVDQKHVEGKPLVKEEGVA